MEIIKIASKAWYKLYVILFCCILNAGVLNASGRLDVDTTVYVVADEGPEFKGDMIQWIGENVQYPQVAWDNGIMGKVIVAFIVEKDGKVSNVQVVRGVHESLNEEALRVFNKMPAWKPAKIKEENVRYRFTCPLTFNIERAEAEPYSYDEFITMLDREGKIPLENIQEETDPVIIQMYVAQKQQFLKGGESAFKQALDRISPSYNVRVPASFVREYKLDKEQQKKLDAVYKWKRLEQEKLIKRMGKKDLIKRYAELSPLFAHLNILEEAKIRECMNPEQHLLYFHDLMEGKMISHEPDGHESCSCKCFYHLNVSLHGIGGIQNWIAREVKYPIIAQERNIQGKVVVGFLINTDGSISDVHVVQSVDPSLDAESVRVMRRLLPFAPVICPIHKRKVAVYYTAPINFQLQ